MRVALVVHRFPPESVGGTEIYTRSLGLALTAMGHEVHVFYPDEALSAVEQFERDGLHLWKSPRPTGRGANPAARFWLEFRHGGVENEFERFLATVRPDVVHFQHVQWVSARLIALAQGLPRIVTLHDYWYFCANGQLIRPNNAMCPGPAWGWRCVDCGAARAGAPWMRAVRPLAALPFTYRNLYLRRVLATVDRFVAPSSFVRDRYVQEGLPPKRITVIEHGLNRHRLAPGTQPLPAPPGRPHFGYLGSIAWQKGIHVLIEAFNAMPRHAGLTIYGNPQLFPEYAEHLRRLARHPGIRFAGPLDHDAVGDALRQMDYLVVPSVWYETYSLVAQEALGAGVPVVASHLGALTERVREGETGRLFEPGDSADLARVLAHLIQHPELRDLYRSHIRPGSTIEEHAGQILALYSQVQHEAVTH